MKAEDQCDDCGWKGVTKTEDISHIPDLFERIEAGGVVPSGECNKCGALCYPIEDQYRSKFSGKKKLEGESQTNNDRVKRATNAIIGWRGYEVADEANLRDLLSDLMHYCHKYGVNFEKELASARRRWIEER
jgi:hypothetical protein